LVRNPEKFEKGVEPGGDERSGKGRAGQSLLVTEGKEGGRDDQIKGAGVEQECRRGRTRQSRKGAHRRIENCPAMDQKGTDRGRDRKRAL